MAWVEDRWYFQSDMENPTSRCGGGYRWRVRWADASRIEHSQSFEHRPDAEVFLENLGKTRRCLVFRCKTEGLTKPPVVLCIKHRDMLLAQYPPPKPEPPPCEPFPARVPKHDPVVYFVRNGSRVKIGWTTNLKGRISGLSLRQSSVALTLPGGEDREHILHQKFAASQIDGMEWFESSPELEAFITRCRTEGEDAISTEIPPGSGIPLDWMSVAALAAYFKTSEAEILSWHHDGYGPVGVRFGSALAYPPSEVERFMEEGTPGYDDVA